MAADQWYYTQSGQKSGPIQGSDLKRLAVAGKIVPTDMVWREGMSEWSPASRVEGLFPVASVSAVPPPVPPSVLAVADAPETNLDDRYNGLYRSSDQRVLFGLAGGLAHKFGAPVWVFRVAFFLGAFFFVGWAYIGALFLPKLPTKHVPRPV